MDPFTGLPLVETVSGTATALAATSEQTGNEQITPIEEHCDLEDFILSSDSGSSCKRKTAKFKYKYKYQPGRGGGCSDSCDEHSDRASDTFSVHSSEDSSDIGYSSSIPESEITIGKHQLYREGIKDQTKQLRKLAAAVKKTFYNLNVVRDIALEQIVDAKAIYERRIRDMTEIMKKANEDLRSQWESKLNSENKAENNEDVLGVSGTDLIIEDNVVCLFQWFWQHHTGDVPMPNSKAELEWLYEAYNLKGYCPCQWHDENYLADVADDTTSTSSSSADCRPCVESEDAHSTAHSSLSSSLFVSERKYTSDSSSSVCSDTNSSSESSSDCGPCGH